MSYIRAKLRFFKTSRMQQRTFLGLIFSLLMPLMVGAQHELGVKFGFSNYLGDLAPGIVPSESNLSGGAFYRFNYNAKWKFRVGAMYGRISGSDRNFRENEERNLSFRTNLIEAELIAEYHLLPFIPGAGKLTFSPYVFAGIAGFRYQPQAMLTSSWLNLRDLGTEGQTSSLTDLEPYGMYSISIPLGIGFKKTITDLVTFGMEVSYRPTFIDYLDDVSRYYVDPAVFADTDAPGISAALADRRPEIGLERADPGTLRGNPEDNDKYLVFMITISKRLGYAPCYDF